MKIFLWTEGRRETSKRMIKPLSGLTLSEVSRWVLLFVISRVCLSDPAGHVYVTVRLCVWLLMPTTMWPHLQSLLPWRASSDHWGDLIASRGKGLLELTDQSQVGSRKTNGPVFHCWCSLLIFSLSVGAHEKQRDSRLFCTGLKTFPFNLKEFCDFLVCWMRCYCGVQMLYEVFLAKNMKW